MDVHKPKPVHNWRELLTEVGVIVLSVCIALAAEQAVEWWHWRARVQEAREIITAEMTRNIGFGIERLKAARCGEMRLQAITKILDNASRTGTLPPVGVIGAMSLRPWSSGAWDSVVASQTATHFRPQQLAALSLVYQRVVRVENWNRQETEAWTVLRGLMGPGRSFNPATDAEMRKAVNLALQYNYVITTTSERLIQGALGLELPFSAEENRELAEAIKNADSVRSSNCQPVSTVPVAAVGIDEQAVSHFNQSLKRLPWANSASVGHR